MIPALVVTFTSLPGLITTSFFEWTVHKCLLHRPVPFLKIWFEGHTRIHHVKFKFDYRYHLQSDDDKEDNRHDAVAPGTDWIWFNPLLRCDGFV